MTTTTMRIRKGKRKLQSILDNSNYEKRKQRHTISSFKTSEVWEEGSLETCTMLHHIQRITEPFIRNSTIIQYSLTAMVGACVLVEESSTSTKDIMFFRRRDSHRMFKLCIWQPNHENNNNERYLCFTDLNKRRHDWCPGYYQYQWKLSSSGGVTSMKPLMQNLLLPIGVELAANPFEWDVTFGSIIPFAIPFPEFARTYCNIFICR